MIRLLPALLLAAALAAEEAPLTIRLLSGNSREMTRALVDLAHDGPTATRDLERARLAIGDADPSVRLAAMGAVARLHDDAAVPLLADAMRSLDQATALDAHASLIAIVGSDIGKDDPDAWRRWDADMAKQTQSSVERFRQALDHNDEVAARAAIHPLLMQRAGRDMIVDALVQAVGSDKPRLAALAREGLTHIDSATARLALRTLGQSGAADAGGAAQGVALAGRDGGTAAPAGTAVTAAAPAHAAGGGWWLLPLLAAGVGFALAVIVLWRRSGKQATRRFTRVFVLKRKGAPNAPAASAAPPR